MNILIVNTHDQLGGAARSAYRLHQGLQKAGVNSTMLVQNKTTEDPTVLTPLGFVNNLRKKFKTRWEIFQTQKYPSLQGVMFSVAASPSGSLIDLINHSDADIVHLHWVHEGMIRLEDLPKITKPIVWSMHDNWLFTGGCHVKWGCDHYLHTCGNCPLLESHDDHDLSYRIWKRKHRVFSAIDSLTFIGLSRWMAHCATQSSLLQSFEVVNLPNPLDTTRYSPVDKKIAKSLLGINPDGHLIVFGAMNSTSDTNKGFIHLRNALDHLTTPNVELAIFGNAPMQSPQAFPFTAHYLGKFHDDLTLRILYSAATVMVVPSLQENLSNAIMEALACGTPVVAFDVGGNGDLIDHQRNGYLARPYESEDLAYGIDWVLSHNDHAQLSTHGREKVLSCFERDRVIPRYVNLYRTLLPKED